MILLRITRTILYKARSLHGWALRRTAQAANDKADSAVVFANLAGDNANKAARHALILNEAIGHELLALTPKD